MLTPFLDSLSAEQLDLQGVTAQVIGHSEQGRELHGLRCGDPQLPLVSIVAGAHPDEPAGPVAAIELLRQWSLQALAQQVQLAVVPLMDVDGVVAQRDWLTPWDGAIDLQRYLQHRQRRLPGADREFAWPGAPWGGTVLPECAAAAAFLDECGPAIAHCSLHGMFMAHGPWFLLDRPALADGQLWQDCRDIAAAIDLPLHEFHRHGDKGFRRSGRGFCTTPSGAHMRRTFLALNDWDTAAGFGYGSMDSARARAQRHGAPPPLTGISEFPLIATPAGCDAAAIKERFTAVATGAESVVACYAATGCSPVPLHDQVRGMIAMVKAVVRAGLRRAACGTR